jgi:ribose/xylose/arabinose/galactoside ABC-type transport system permease subunit
MTVLTEEPESTPEVPDTAAELDERVTFRGPLRRMLVTPEIGALIGALLVWVFFWGVGDNFGTASGASSYLDVAAPLGIMAVAVSLLMIGGEFDLSAGVMTGASGILVGLMANNFLGDGASLWLAVPAAFLAAGCVGWFNGTVVNRTGLPSFIVTLGMFFVLRGVNLVFAKRLVDKVVVSGIDDAGGFDTFHKIFASTHTRDTFDARDPIFLVLALAGVLLITWGLLEASFVRRARTEGSGLFVAAGGAALGVFSLVMLSQTDGTANNVLWTVIGGAGAVIAVAGFAAARYETTSLEGPLQLGRGARPLVIGLVCVAAALVVSSVLDPGEGEVILSWLPSGVRVGVAVLAAFVGIALMALYWRNRVRSHVGVRKTRTIDVVRMVLITLVVGLLALIGTLTFLQLTTVQAFRAVVVVALGAFGVLTLLRARGAAAAVSRKGQLLIGLIAAAAIVAIAISVRAEASAVRFRTGLFAALLLAAIAVIANTIVEVRGVKRTAPEPAVDRFARRLGFSGLGIVAVGFAIRLFFTGADFRISIFWWIVATAVATFVLVRTKYGNWIFAVGGNKEAARSIGVPASAVKVGLFMTTSLAGCFVGMMTALRLTSVQAQQGIGEEFEYIIAAVVGGNLLTGGYGSAAGAAIGALIMAMSQIGIPYAQWNQDGRFVFLGVVLLLAVLVNNAVRKRAQEAQ